jgi:hypothetical protein
LAGDTERVTDLLPRPSAAASLGDVVGLDPLGEPVQGEGGAKPRRRVLGRQGRADLLEDPRAPFERERARRPSVACARPGARRPSGCAHGGGARC